MKILVVEDSESMQALLKLRLVRAGYEVHFAKDGETGVAAALQIQPDLVLMDFSLPGAMQGDVAVKTLQERGYQGKIVALTGSTTSDDQERMLAAGCIAIITKPINKQDFIKTVANFI